MKRNNSQTIGYAIASTPFSVSGATSRNIRVPEKKERREEKRKQKYKKNTLSELEEKN